LVALINKAQTKDHGVTLNVAHESSHGERMRTADFGWVLKKVFSMSLKGQRAVLHCKPRYPPQDMGDPVLGEDLEGEGELEYEDFVKLSTEDQVHALLEFDGPPKQQLFELFTGREAKQERKARKQKSDQEQFDELIREVDPSMVGKIKLASGQGAPGSISDELGLTEEEIAGVKFDPSVTYAGDKRSEMERDLGLSGAELAGLKVEGEPELGLGVNDDDIYEYAYQAAPGSIVPKPSRVPTAGPPKSTKRVPPKGQPSEDEGNDPAEEGVTSELQTESQGLDSAALEEEIARLLNDPDVSKLSDEAVGERLIQRFSDRFKEKGKEAVKSAVYTWWQNNWRRIARDSALSIGGALLFNFALPMLGGPALGFNMYTFMKEMGTSATLWPLAGTILSGVAGAARGALFNTARDAVRGKNLLGASAVQKAFQFLHLGSPTLDASILIDAAEIPLSVAMRPGTFKRIFLEPFGIWEPVLKHKKTLWNEFFWGNVSAAGSRAASRLGQRSGVIGWVGRAVKTTAMLPNAILTRLMNSDAIKNAKSKAKDVFVAGMARGADYVNSKVFQKELAAAVREDQSNVQLQETVKNALDSAIEKSVKEADTLIEERFEKDPVEEQYIRAAFSTPLPSPPAPIMAAQAEGLSRSGRVSTLVALGTTAAGWVVASMAANAVGAPSLSELASVLPEEYTDVIARATSSISSNVDVNQLMYTAISSSIGLNGLIKSLAGKIPLPQLEALQKLSRRVSSVGQSLVGEDSSVLAREFIGIMLGTKIYTKKALEAFSWEELRAMWVAKGGKDVTTTTTKATLINALIKAQKDAASVLHTQVVEGIASQAASVAGSTALAGAATLVYSNAQGIYSAISENGIIAAAAGIDEAAQKTLAGMTVDSSLDPYGIFSASARYSRDVAAVLAESGNVALSRAYEAKRKLDDYIGSVANALKPQSPQETPLVLPDLAKLNSAEGFESMRQFTNRLKSLASIKAGLPAPGEEQTSAFSKETIQLLKEADLASEANFYAKGGLSRPVSQSPFVSSPVDERAFEAGKRLTQEIMKRTGSSVGEALRGMRKSNVDAGLVDEMIATALLGGLFGIASPGTTTAAPVIATPGTSAPTQAPLEINRKALEETKGILLDPVSDFLAMRTLEFGLDSGLTALAAWLSPATAAIQGGIGLYNQGAKWTNRALDFATISRAVAMSLDATKDSALAKMPKPTSFRLPEVGSVKELLAKLPVFDQIAEQRKIDAGAVVAEEVTKYAASLLPGQERISKFQLFTNIALGLAGPLTPGLGELATQKYMDVVNGIRDKLIEEDSLSASVAKGP
jgi:hypothetical protein